MLFLYSLSIVLPMVLSQGIADSLQARAAGPVMAIVADTPVELESMYYRDKRQATATVPSVISMSALPATTTLASSTTSTSSASGNGVISIIPISNLPPGSTMSMSVLPVGETPSGTGKGTGTVTGGSSGATFGLSPTATSSSGWFSIMLSRILLNEIAGTASSNSATSHKQGTFSIGCAVVFAVLSGFVL